MKFKIEYDNGEIVEAKVKPRHLVRFEDEVGLDSERVADGFKLAYYASGSSLPYSEWLDTVDEITNLDVPVTEGAPSVDGEAPAERVPTE